MDIYLDVHALKISHCLPHAHRCCGRCAAAAASLVTTTSLFTECSSNNWASRPHLHLSRLDCGTAFPIWISVSSTQSFEIIILLCLSSEVKCVCSVGIKKYIVGLIIKTSSDGTLMEREKVYLGKLNMILVQVCCFFCSVNTVYRHYRDN